MKYLYSIRKGSEVVRRFFSPSDFDTLEYFLSLFSSLDDDVKKSYLFEDHSVYSVYRDGFFSFGSEFVPCSCHLFKVTEVFDYCAEYDFNGAYSVSDVLESWDCFNFWIDRWNSIVNTALEFERDLAPSPDSPSAIGSESSSRPDQPHCGDSEAKADCDDVFGSFFKSFVDSMERVNSSASSDAGVSPACEEAQPPTAESEVIHD